jgi:hypothetical protein
MSKYILAILLIFIFVLPILSFSIPNEPTNVTNYKNSLTFYDNLTYKIVVHNATSTNSTKYNLNYTLVAKYNVEKFNNGYVTVNVTVNDTNVQSTAQNKTFNFTLIKSGIYNVSLQKEFLNLSYPFIAPEYLFNNSYSLQSSISSISLDFINYSIVNIIGIRYNTTEFSFSTSGLSGKIWILPNGNIAKLNATYNGVNVNMTLDKFSSLSIGNLSTIYFPKDLLNRSYLYTVFEYSSFAKTIQSVGEEEIIYPIVFSNGIIGESSYSINTISGEPIIATSDFIIHIGNYTNMDITFYPNMSKTIVWGSSIFKFVGYRNITIFNKNYNNALVYTNSTNSSIQTLIFNKSGILLEYSVKQNASNTFITEFETKYIGNKFYSSNITFTNLNAYSNTKLPFKVIAPTLSLVATIIITLVIVAVLVILHRRE